ncbi:DHH family phosphoesterase [Proteiniclasticum sp.]|uniref:DHH family phosphoesterase n=1 Tax=Proteiniclasticum sp. TaxID=2053595 RepID=UPI00289BC06C|nr:DHH family phosphoesterase [Proteiniclasticum sp.]
MKKYYEFRKIDFLYSLIITAAIIALYLTGEWIVASGLFIVFIIILFYLNSRNTYKKKKWEKFVVNMISKMSKSTVQTLEQTNIPIILLREGGEIIWYNKESLELFQVKNHNFQLADITQKNREEILMLTESGFVEVNIKDKEYHVMVIPVEHKENEFHEKLRVLIFNDVSILREAETKLSTVVSIEIDNYSDLMSSIDTERKPFLLAEIENFIYSYGHEMKAMVRKYETNKFMMVISEYHINEQMRKKFPVIDAIKNIDQGNSIEPTLSIGVGRGGASPEENQNLSKAAKELALGRGGDQVVIKSPDNLSFYGGSSKEIEKKSRVRSRVVAHALKDIIEESNKIYIMGHKNPDMDCFGAAVGIKVIAKGLGKKAMIINEEPYLNIMPIYNKIIEIEEYREDIISIQKALTKIKPQDTLIIVDVHANNYVLDHTVVEKFEKVVIIDHHRRTPEQITGAVLSYIETYASSTSELVTELIQYTFEKPDMKIIEAEALFAGIRVDTKSFTFKTGVRTFEAASFLKRQGARTVEVREMFASDLDSYNQKAEIIRQAEIVDKIALAKVYEIEDVLLSAQAADELANFKDINGAFVLTAQDNDIIINGRSLKELNVQMILEELGGGGHMTMAGAKLADTDMDTAEELLMEAINKHRKEENSL